MELNGNSSQGEMPESKFMLMRQGGYRVAEWWFRPEKHAWGQIYNNEAEVQMGMNGNSAQRKMAEAKLMLMSQGGTNVAEW